MKILHYTNSSAPSPVGDGSEELVTVYAVDEIFRMFNVCSNVGLVCIILCILNYNLNYTFEDAMSN